MTKKEIGEKIRVMREARGMTQKDLAIAIHMSESAITMYERGERRPSDSAAEALADVFNVPKWSIYYHENEVIPIDEAKNRIQVINESNLSPFEIEDWTALTDVYKRLPKEKQHLPDYELAATIAMETLIKYRISSAPISPLPMLKNSPGVLVLSYMEIAELIGLSRENVVTLIGAENQNAMTFVKEIGGRLKYVVAFNMRAPLYALQFALARELGHIVIGHDGSRDDDVRAAEVECFANYLLFPRPLIRAVLDADLPLTVRNFGRATGCYGKCLSTLAETPGVPVSKQLNRIVKNQFTDYVENCAEFEALFAAADRTPTADLGTFMDNYVE